MALSTFSVAPRQSDNATWRAWGSALNTALAAAGLTQNSAGEVSGQIDWTASAYPATASTAVGYEFWHFSDTLQATYPVFIKLEYGSGAAATSPALWLTVGTTHDGAGNLTGLTTTRYQIRAGVNSTTASTSRVSGDTNRIAVAMWESAADLNTALWFSVERTKDAAGAVTAAGLMITTFYASNARQVVYLFASGETGVETTFGALMPSVGSGAAGSAIAVYPVFLTQGTFLNPLDTLLLCFASNFTAGVEVSFTFYGATKKFMPLNATGFVPVIRGTIAGGMFLMRNE